MINIFGLVDHPPPEWSWVEIVESVLYLVAAHAAIVGVISMWQLGKRNPNISPMIPICALLVASIAAGAPTWARISVGDILCSAPSITAAPGQPAQYP